MATLTPSKAFIASLLFVALSLVFKLVPWWGLSFLGERSVVRSTVAGLVALVLVVVVTRTLLRWRAQWADETLVLFPSLNSIGMKLAIGGFVVGAVLFAAVFLGVYATGGLFGFSLAVEAGELPSLLVGIFIATIFNAAWEEFTFRGWPFAVCVRAFGPHVVAIALGAVFGLAHLLNSKWTVAAIASVSVAGWLLCYAMLAFRNILVVIGLHVGWNLVQSLMTSKVLWSYSEHDNPIVSGGRYGLEASGIGIAITVLAAGICFFVFLRGNRRRSEVQGPARA